MPKGKRHKRTTRKWRKSGEETAKEAMRVLEAKHAQSAMRSLKDSDLFVIDRDKKSGGDAGSGKVSSESVSTNDRREQGKKRPRREKKVKRNEQIVDIWASSGDNSLTSRTRRGQPNSNRLRSKRREEEMIKRDRAKIDAVCVPDEGLSYHPAKDAHEEAISEAAAKELARYQRLESEKLPKVNEVDAVDDFSDSDEGGDDEGAMVDEDRVSKRSRTGQKDRKKTRADRNRELRHKEMLRRQREAKREKALNHQIRTSKRIQKDIEQREADLRARRSVRDKLREDARLNPTKRTIVIGGKKTIYEPAPEVALSEELRGSVREMKPQGNMLRDRWYSMLERQKFELGDKTTVKRLRKQQKRKHKAYGKTHWGVEFLKKDAKKRMV